MKAHIRRRAAIVDARRRSFYDRIPSQRRRRAGAEAGPHSGALGAPYDQFATGNAGAGGTTLKSNRADLGRC